MLAGIQVEISSSQLEMTLYMTDCWSWLEKWKLKSFFEKFKLWFDRNHTVSKSGNTQKHSAVEDRPQGGREREHWAKEGVAFEVCFPGQLKDGQHVKMYVVGPLLESSWISDSFFLLCLTKPLPSLSWSLSYPMVFPGLEYLEEGSEEVRGLVVGFPLHCVRKADNKEQLAGRVLRLCCPFWFVHECCGVDSLPERGWRDVCSACLGFIPLAL